MRPSASNSWSTLRRPEHARSPRVRRSPRSRHAPPRARVARAHERAAPDRASPRSPTGAARNTAAVHRSRVRARTHEPTSRSRPTEPELSAPHQLSTVSCPRRVPCRRAVEAPIKGCGRADGHGHSAAIGSIEHGRCWPQPTKRRWRRCTTSCRFRSAGGRSDGDRRQRQSYTQTLSRVRSRVSELRRVPALALESNSTLSWLSTQIEREVQGKNEGGAKQWRFR